MTQPISSYRPDCSQDVPDSSSPRPLATRVAVPQPSLPELPELPDIDAALIANAVKAATGGASQSPHLLFAMGVKGADVEYTTRDTVIQQRLDAFKESATPKFHTKDGQEVSVAIPFRMRPRESLMAQRDDASQPFIRQERIARANVAVLKDLAASVGVRGRAFNELTSGRGTPENIRRVTQALIDANQLPPGTKDDADARIRTMMCNYGVGLDCAGYVQQAFLASRGVSRAEVGFQPPVLEDLGSLAKHGFRDVTPSGARAGDLFILKPPGEGQVGHTAIVRDVRSATPEEAQVLSTLKKEWGHPDAAAIQRLELDSSWGNSADPQLGGVQRQFFWHDTVSGQWMHQTNGTWCVNPADKPYLKHALQGVFRLSKEP